MFLLCNEGEDKALHLTWKLRWYIAQEIGGTLRYLHEECADGPIVHLSVSSSSIVFSQGCSAMVSLQLFLTKAHGNQTLPTLYVFELPIETRFY